MRNGLEICGSRAGSERGARDSCE